MKTDEILDTLNTNKHLGFHNWKVIEPQDVCLEKNAEVFSKIGFIPASSIFVSLSKEGFCFLFSEEAETMALTYLRTFKKK